MSKHTPGPWFIEPDGHHLLIFGGAYRDEDGVTVQTKVGRVEGNATSGPVIEANARLMAAAPELLAACKDLLPHARRAINALNEQMIGSLYPAVNLALLDRAEKAIARAEEEKA
jgi:hypothetical protein